MSRVRLAYLLPCPATDCLAAIPGDRNYDYTVSVSSVEIYNEKVYDLLDSPTPTPIASSASSAHSATSIFSSSIGFLGAKAKAFGVKGLQSVKRTALSLKYDSKAGNKYVHGMKEIHVLTADVRLFPLLSSSSLTSIHDIGSERIARSRTSESTSLFHSRQSRFFKISFRLYDQDHSSTQDCSSG